MTVLFSQMNRFILFCCTPTTSLTLFDFTDKTKIIYTAAATQEALPGALGKGSHKGEEHSPCTTQPFPQQPGIQADDNSESQCGQLRNSKNETNTRLVFLKHFQATSFLAKKSFTSAESRLGLENKGAKDPGSFTYHLRVTSFKKIKRQTYSVTTNSMKAKTICLLPWISRTVPDWPIKLHFWANQ